MDSSQQVSSTLRSPASSQASSASFSIPAANYLTVPSTKPLGFHLSLPGPTSSKDDDLELELYPPSRQSTPTSNHFPHILEPPRSRLPSNQRSSRSPPRSEKNSTAAPGPFYMSVYSASSSGSEQSTYSNPPARIYRVPSFQNMSGSRKITVAEKDQMIQSLRSHQINTLIELRRIERAFALLGSPDVTEPMTAAWSYYVNSHSLLTEMRALTKNYPFSAECLEEAKNRVYSDPQSNRSWNFCWLVLSKIKNDKLIPYYAHYQAAQPAMWGGRTPTSEGVDKLSAAFVVEWTWALEQMLRHWEQSPTSR